MHTVAAISMLTVMLACGSNTDPTAQRVGYRRPP
jgi:hypothetical protein